MNFTFDFMEVFLEIDLRISQLIGIERFKGLDWNERSIFQEREYVLNFGMGYL